jgi:hypothetical protein
MRLDDPQQTGNDETMRGMASTRLGSCGSGAARHWRVVLRRWTACAGMLALLLQGLVSAAHAPPEPPPQGACCSMNHAQHHPGDSTPGAPSTPHKPPPCPICLTLQSGAALPPENGNVIAAPRTWWCVVLVHDSTADGSVGYLAARPRAPPYLT